MTAWWVEGIGLLAGALGIVAWIPQIKEVWIHQRHEGISVAAFSVVSIALLLWLIYGLIVKSVAMVVANVFTLAVIFIIVFGVVRLRRTEGAA
jgi:MtN3 and saliva related transmembrane protein